MSESAKTTRKLLRGRYVVTDPLALPESGLTEDAALLVEGSRIAEVGEWRVLRQRFPDAETFGSAHHLVLPGFVNAHHHGRGLSSVQLGVPDDVVERWLLDYWRVPPLEVYLDTLYANLRMLRSGVTTVIHSSYAREWGGIEAETRDALRAYADAGQRVAYAVGFDDRVQMVFGDEAAFLDSLPGGLALRTRALLQPADEAEVDRYFSFVSALAEQGSANPALRVLHGPSWHVWCSRPFLERVAEDARDKALGIHTHVLESPLERDHAMHAYGTDCVSYLQALGFHGRKVSFAHGTWFSEADIAACAESGISVSHNPSSNLRLRNGIAPVAGMLEGGVNVALGMDSWGVSSDDDILSELRLASLLHRLYGAAPLRPGQGDYGDGQGGEPQDVRQTPSPAADRPAEPFDEPGVAQAPDGRAPLPGRAERHERHDRQRQQQVQGVRLAEGHGAFSGMSVKTILGNSPEDRVTKRELEQQDDERRRQRPGHELLVPGEDPLLDLGLLQLVDLVVDGPQPARVRGAEVESARRVGHLP